MLESKMSRFNKKLRNFDDILTYKIEKMIQTFYNLLKITKKIYKNNKYKSLINLYLNDLSINFFKRKGV